VCPLPPLLGRNGFAGHFQNIQIPGGSVIQGKFGAVRGLIFSPRFRLHGNKLLMDAFVFGILRPHGKAFIENGNPALGADDFSAQGVIITVHCRGFSMKLPHGSDAVGLQEIEQGDAFLERLYLALQWKQVQTLDIRAWYNKTT
jgi:hypothetical protein